MKRWWWYIRSKKSLCSALSLSLLFGTGEWCFFFWGGGICEGFSSSQVFPLNLKWHSMSLEKGDLVDGILIRWMTDVMSECFPKEEAISGINLTQRSQAFTIDHYSKQLLSWLYHEPLWEAALQLQTEGWRHGEEWRQFLRGLLPPDFKGQKSHTVAA